jgi:hypothetical protein
MREFEAISRQRFDKARIATQDLLQSEYHRLKAEVWLAKAKEE